MFSYSRRQRAQNMAKTASQCGLRSLDKEKLRSTNQEEQTCNLPGFWEEK